MELFAAVSVSHHLVTVLRQRRSGTFKDVAYLPYPFEGELPVGTLEINVTHHTGLQLKVDAGKPAVSLMPHIVGETTTACCFDALSTQASWIKNVRHVTSAHFDVDNFVAVWTVLHPSVALTYKRVVLEIARVGDFRELRLDEPWQHEALKVICWLHSEERRNFQKSYESKSTATSENNGLGTRKFEYFLPLFAGVLARPDDFKEQWGGEYERVVKEYAAVNATPSTTYPQLGCVVVKLPEPAHYYALFSTSIGYDVVFSMYRGNRYEVELKYTSIVPLGRAVLPRVDMSPLAAYLNSVEQVKRSQRESTTLAVTITDKYYWHCDAVTDSGPILRLESKTKNLKKAERYVHPYERPIYPSLIEPSEMEPLVISFLAHAYANVKAKKEWSSDDLRQFESSINWLKWEKAVAEIKFQPPR
jgi:hypothetical protein